MSSKILSNSDFNPWQNSPAVVCCCSTYVFKIWIKSKHFIWFTFRILLIFSLLLLIYFVHFSPEIENYCNSFCQEICLLFTRSRYIVHAHILSKCFKTFISRERLLKITFGQLIKMKKIWHAYQKYFLARLGICVLRSFLCQLH